ncbi:MAG TPA: hypothetical protein EYO00_00170 [Gammaproteobacteria bacterium]|jgi:hypothetical protein|nr:hypothetical protein [Gammaproteobacteria bacterium]HIF85564.1 hypothetical protein [Gammaproteobacteria bacterium]HIL64302.1 hypothetical protein [Porticoccaceae bacterium]HIN90709.1 hypothetical protein [Porticoccaceae bacterium]|tara:strand:- start:24467 stop:24883 length:417 start_codon:yes stop_codon:yes gene_type:complete
MPWNLSRNLDIQCWKCGSELKKLLLPFSRSEECSSCNADLRVCRGCKNYAADVADACTEERAEFVADKDRANFCDYFDPHATAYRKQDDADAQRARNKLAELFGEEPPADESDENSNSPLSEADTALAKLNRLFGDKD